MTNKQRLTAELAALLLIGFVVAGRSGPRDKPVPDVLRAHRFELVDKAGKLRCDIRVDEDLNSPYLRMLDTNGKERLALMLSDNQSPRLLLNDKNGFGGLLLD